MNEYHVTYVRDADRTRVVFVIRAQNESWALEDARKRAPRGFRHCALRRHEGGQITVPMDGDNYGAEIVPPHWTPAAVA